MFSRSSKITSIATVAGFVVAGWFAGTTIANAHNLALINSRVAATTEAVTAARQGIVIRGIAQIQTQSLMADADATKAGETLAALDAQLAAIDGQLKEATAKRDELEQHRRSVALNAGIEEIKLHKSTADRQALAEMAGRKATDAAPYLRGINQGHGG